MMDQSDVSRFEPLSSEFTDLLKDVFKENLQFVVFGAFRIKYLFSMNILHYF